MESGTKVIETTNSKEILTVSQLNRLIAGVLERSFPLAWVSGEISNFNRASSGHWYFSLKDAQAQIRCVMFRGRNQLNTWVPREGEAVEVRALLGMYEARGELQLNVEAMRKAGQGSLFEAFMRLKEKLGAEGLFDADRKQLLPPHPTRIGVITSLQAAALKDVLSALSRRAPHLKVVIYPAPVQGQGAGERLAEQVQRANQRNEVDVLLLCRGGGSIEDLWAFNEEVLARAIAASFLPVVSGVGHETDFTIADFVADVRAPTPTAAAELVSPDREQLQRTLSATALVLQRQWQRQFEREIQKLDHLARRLQSPQEQLKRQQAELKQADLRLQHALRIPLWRAQTQLETLRSRLQQCAPDLVKTHNEVRYLWEKCGRAFQRQFTAEQAQLTALGGNLELLSPQRTLARGYAVLLTQKGRKNKAVRHPKELLPGIGLSVKLAEGEANIVLADVQTALDMN